jgi:dihydrolipoamide dehydrogenase
VPPRTFKSAPKSLIAMNLETTEEELIHAVFPHPTLSEMMHESVLDAYGRVIHV